VFQLAQANILSVDTDDDGMLVEQLADLLETTRVKAVYLVPTFGNPGGKTLSETRRRRLVELAKKYDFVILEDDPMAKLASLTPFDARSISTRLSWAVKIRWFTPRPFRRSSRRGCASAGS
jgi:DNA-binding transcriptional MocR family regulator